MPIGYELARAERNACQDRPRNIYYTKKYSQTKLRKKKKKTLTHHCKIIDFLLLLLLFTRNLENKLL